MVELDSLAKKMKTKHYLRFLNRAAHLDADIELADVVAIAVRNGALSRILGGPLLDTVIKDQHPILHARTSNDHNRRLAVRHLKATVCSSFIKDVYEEVSFYLRSLLESAALNGLEPGRLIGEHSVEFDANQVLCAGSWKAVVLLISQSIFRKLEEEKSTLKLIQKMNNKLALGVPDLVIKEALPYLELRHLFIHSDGVPDAEFCKKYPILGFKAGEKIALDYDLVQVARRKIYRMVSQFDAHAIKNKIVAHTELTK